MSETMEIPVVEQTEKPFDIKTAPKKETPTEFAYAQAIADVVDDFLLHGRPGAHGQLQQGRRTTSRRDREAGGRANLCGEASGYTVEVVENMNKKGTKLIAKALQAKNMAANLTENSGDPYPESRTHGYAIVADPAAQTWALIDRTFNQFVEKDAEDALVVKDSHIPLNADGEFPLSRAAQQLYENGWVKGSKENLAAFISLMLIKPGQECEEYYQQLLERFNKSDFEYLKAMLELPASSESRLSQHAVPNENKYNRGIRQTLQS